MRNIIHNPKKHCILIKAHYLLLSTQPCIACLRHGVIQSAVPLQTLLYGDYIVRLKCLEYSHLIHFTVLTVMSTLHALFVGSTANIQMLLYFKLCPTAIVWIQQTLWEISYSISSVSSPAFSIQTLGGWVAGSTRLVIKLVKISCNGPDEH